MYLFQIEVDLMQKGFYKKTSFEDKFNRKTRRWIEEEIEKNILERNYGENKTD